MRFVANTGGRRLYGATAALVPLLWATGAMAQTTTLHGAGSSTTPGFALGPFTLVPEVVVTGTYDSNVNRTDTGDIADYNVLVAAIASMQSRAPTHEVNINLGGGIRRYSKAKAQNDDTYAAGVNGRYSFSPAFTVNGDVSARRDLVGPGNIERALGGSNAVSLTEQASAGFTFTSMPVIVSASASYADRGSRNASNVDDAVRELVFDRAQASVTSTVTYVLGPAFSPFVTASFTDIEYEDSSDPFANQSDSDAVQVQAGFNFALAQNFGGVAQIGVNSQDYVSSILGEQDVLVATIGTQWAPTPEIMVQAGFNRAYNEIRVPGIPVPGFITEGLQISATRTVPGLELKASLTLADVSVITAVPLPPPFPTKVEATQFEFRAGGTYAVNAALRLKAEGVYEERTSEFSGLAYDNTSLALTVLYGF